MLHFVECISFFLFSTSTYPQSAFRGVMCVPAQWCPLSLLPWGSGTSFWDLKLSFSCRDWTSKCDPRELELVFKDLSSLWNFFFKSTWFSQTYSAFEQSSQQELSGMFLRLDHLGLTREHLLCYRFKSRILLRATCLENGLPTYFHHFSHCIFYS